MTFPNALFIDPAHWRADKAETPLGGLMPMGVHAIDGMIDLCGPIDHVFAQSFRRAAPIDADDTTSILLRMKEGMSGYLGTMTTTGPGSQLPGVRLEGLAAARRRHPRGRRLLGRAAHAAVRHLQVPAGQGRGQGVAGGDARHLARRARSLRQGGGGRAGLSDPARTGDPRRRRHRGHHPLGRPRRKSSRSIDAAASANNKSDYSKSDQETTHGSRQRSRPPDLFDAGASRPTTGSSCDHSLVTYLPKVKARFAGNQRFGVCMRLSAKSARDAGRQRRRARQAEKISRRQRHVHLHRQRLSSTAPSRERW